MSHTGKIISKIDDCRNIIDCDVCGYIHVYPYPSDSELEEFYSNEYYEKARPDYLKNLKEDYSWWTSIYKNRMELVFKNNPELREKDNIEVIDIGSGAGQFIEVAQEYGCNAIGYEPSKIAYEQAKSRNLNTVNKAFDINSISRKVDLIHMNHVLEHLPEAITTVRNINKSLFMNGIFLVSVPNDYNKFQLRISKKQNKKNWWESPFEHLNYFTFDSLSKIVEENGFEVQQKFTTFPMEIFLLMGEDYLDNSSKGRSLHNKRKNFDKSLFGTELYFDFYSMLAEKGLGRDVILIAKKVREIN